MLGCLEHNGSLSRSGVSSSMARFVAMDVRLFTDSLEDYGWSTVTWLASLHLDVSATMARSATTGDCSFLRRARVQRATALAWRAWVRWWSSPRGRAGSIRVAPLPRPAVHHRVPYSERHAPGKRMAVKLGRAANWWVSRVHRHAASARWTFLLRHAFVERMTDVSRLAALSWDGSCTWARSRTWVTLLHGTHHGFWVSETSRLACPLWASPDPRLAGQVWVTKTSRHAEQLLDGTGTMARFPALDD